MLAKTSQRRLLVWLVLCLVVAAYQLCLLSEVKLVGEPGERNDRKLKSNSTVILHVGTPKTATTTIQLFLKANTELLRRDNYQYVGRDGAHNGLVHGTEPRLVNAVESSLANESNLIVSEESLSIYRIARRSRANLRQLLEPYAVIRTVVAYRRLHELFASDYNQNVKRPPPKIQPTARQGHIFWPDDPVYEDPAIPTFVDYFQQKHDLKSSWKTIPTIVSASHFYNWTDSFDIFIMHQEGDLLTNFVCQMIQQPHANHTCQFLKSRRTPSRKSNHADPIEYDRIAVAAYERGWIDRSYNRKDVAQKVRDYHEKTKQLKVKDLPQDCPSQIFLDKIYDISLKTEHFVLSLLYPQYYEKDNDMEPLRQEHLESFNASWQSTLDDYKLCNVHLNETLKLAEWQDFFHKGF